MRYTNKITLTVAAIATAFTFSATAAEGDKPERGGKGERGGDRKRPSPEAMMKKLDKDGDGHLSLAEMKAAKPRGKRPQGDKAPSAEERFKRMDGNGDGKVSKEELAAAFKKMAERRKRGQKGGDKPESAE